ncbi:M48 family metallopeptidase [Polaromonas sp.]|uniref:M48 family metallopeptidase n=1 Tax=Polaromonas sp. TaxID=1869339 RepID=UPI002FC981ED
MNVTLRWTSLLLSATLLASPGALAQREGVEVGKNSGFARLVPASEVEAGAAQQYGDMLRDAAGKKALAPANHPQVMRLRRIAQRIIPYSYDWNPRARDWKWEVNLIGSKQINAFCMPGGKIIFYTGILEQLQLTDDEVAQVMGHEIAHALREHARERIGKNAATQGMARLGGAVVAGIFGLDPRLTDSVARGGANLLTLKFGREDESEADLVGLELAARAGFDPQAGITLWQKMAANGGGAPPEWLSTHPAGNTRIADIERNLPRVMPLYEKAKKR